MAYKDEMEKALLDMVSHPEFNKKMTIEDVVEAESTRVISQKSHPRPSGWWRKRMYKKRLYRRFLSNNPSLNIATCGTDVHPAVVCCSFEEPYNPRHIYSINLFQKLYISPAGDIRICKKRIVHHGGCKVFGIFPSEIPYAKKSTNRRIRRETIHTDSCLPGNPGWYRKKYSYLIDETI